LAGEIRSLVKRGSFPLWRESTLFCGIWLKRGQMEIQSVWQERSGSFVADLGLFYREILSQKEIARICCKQAFFLYGSFAGEYGYGFALSCNRALSLLPLTFAAQGFVSHAQQPYISCQKALPSYACAQDRQNARAFHTKTMYVHKRALRLGKRTLHLLQKSST